MSELLKKDKGIDRCLLTTREKTREFDARDKETTSFEWFTQALDAHFLYNEQRIKTLLGHGTTSSTVETLWTAA